MKGMELIATLISFFVMIGVTTMLGGITISLIQTIEEIMLKTPLEPADYRMALSPLYPPVDYENMLLSYLESTIEVDGKQIPIKTIIVHAAYQRNMNTIFIEGDSIPFADFKEITSDVFNVWAESQGYMLVLNIEGEPHTLADNRRALGTEDDEVVKIRKISVPTFIDSESVVAGSQYLPLDVTLDLYVR